MGKAAQEAAPGLGKAVGAPRLRRPAVRTLQQGEPSLSLAGESPQTAWSLIVGKLDAPGKVQLVEGGLRFLLNFPGLPGRPPPPFLTRLENCRESSQAWSSAPSSGQAPRWRILAGEP